jgi:hypothetical protein
MTKRPEQRLRLACSDAAVLVDIVARADSMSLVTLVGSYMNW